VRIGSACLSDDRKVDTKHMGLDRSLRCEIPLQLFEKAVLRRVSEP
jgi:hypothetical protein